MKKHIKVGLISAVAILSATIHNAQATAIAEGQILWNSLVVAANGNDITSQLSFPDQADDRNDPYDFIGTEYIEGVAVGSHIETETDIDNPNFATILSANEGGSVTPLSASHTPSLITGRAEAEYTSYAQVFSYRQGTFIAPETGTYTFGIDITGSIELNNQNSEVSTSGVLAERLTASAYFELQFINLDSPDVLPDRAGVQNDFTFEYSDNELQSDFAGPMDIDSSIALTSTSFNPTIEIQAGDRILLSTTLQLDVRSNSSQPIPSPVPVPAALWLLSGAALMFKPFVRRVRAG